MRFSGDGPERRRARRALRRVRRGRFRRALGFTRSPLLRHIDRVQQYCAAALLLFALVIVPATALWLGGWAYVAGRDAERAERAGRTRVPVTVTATGGLGTTGDRYVHETVQGVWTGPDGQRRTGTLPAWKDAEVGERRLVWMDRDGMPTVRPRPHSRTVTDAAYAGVVGGLGAVVPFGLVYWTLRTRCDRVRYRLWEADWARMDTDAGNSRPS
ncbi:hypothetical protein BTM25_28640 [Actinomadura rubteroloni]|uniref:Uncharacterized protein n=1 Tax=Actinomadura rubteroloni TaxID=1926885 RepID=A0A2P4UGV2_9ACTN|nr:hypothetical protein [Actinomadura rubteroloni]POM24236.1 hypothetical protein BTM25_28640 [Actinomadura rubteroloni]